MGSGFESPGGVLLLVGSRLRTPEALGQRRSRNPVPTKIVCPGVPNCWRLRATFDKLQLLGVRGGDLKTFVVWPVVAAFILVSGCSTQETTIESGKAVYSEDFPGLVIFATDDVVAEDIQSTFHWHKVAYEEWFDTTSPAAELFFPFYFALLGPDPALASDLNERFCSFDDGIRRKCHSGNNNEASFPEFVRSGDLAHTTIPARDAHHLIIMTNPGAEEFGQAVLHETFHALQKSHISLHPEADSWEGYKLLAGKAIRDGDENLPWWTEGSANYMAMLLYQRQPGVDPHYVADSMTHKLTNENDEGLTAKEIYLQSGVSLDRWGYADENGNFVGRSMGDWFVAFLVHNFGEQSVIDVHRHIPSSDFASAFERVYGMSYGEAIRDFDVFIAQPTSELVASLP